jgi:hypothetical protein
VGPLRVSAAGAGVEAGFGAGVFVSVMRDCACAADPGCKIGG